MKGILPHVLNVRWDKHQSPETLSRFETEARSKRLALILGACQIEGISDLFAGHHQDDQAETLIMRMATNHSVASLGLAGTRIRSTWPRIPLISKETKEDEADRMSIPDALDRKERPHNVNDGDGQLAIAPHVYLNHPLLCFSKESLVKTCNEHGVNYVIDQSNFSPSLTMRNSCRYLIANYQLPRALQGDSLRRLATHTVNFEAKMTTLSDALLYHTTLQSFDLRLGAITARLPDSDQSVWRSVDYRVLAIYLRRIISLISPGDTITTSRCLRIAQILHPRGQGERNEFREHETFSTLKDSKIVCFKNPDDQGWQISLSRQPPRRHQVENYTQKFAFPHSHPGWSSWELFDQRFFIRIRQHSSRPGSQLGLRFLSPKHLSAFRAELCDYASTDPERHSKGQIAGLTSQDFVSLSRDSLYTIPVIYDMSQGEDSLPLAIPTLGVCGNPWAVKAGYQTARVDFQVLYKSIDQAALRLLVATDSDTDPRCEASTK